jgi:uncharacterized lipoprotein YddW (UPF0748 family)
MGKVRKVFFILVFLFSTLAFAEADKRITKGVWVTVFSEKKPLYSKEEALGLVSFCKESGIGEIYLQLYQSGKAYYNTSLQDNTKYKDILKSAGCDTIKLILDEARKNNIRVFAWVNLLSLGKNGEADILKKFGRDILTRDQYLRPSGRQDPNELDRYYLREDQLFLEPGDPRVSKFLIAVCSEIIKRYPGFSGLHLDYLRYPLTVPFAPSSKFSRFCLQYGYGRKNIEHFKSVEGIDPLSGLKRESDFAKWDDWRRRQVTLLAKRISRAIKRDNPSVSVSCAVLPSFERAYSAVFQDWPGWLEDGILDYVVLMNYTLDSQITKEIILSARGLSSKGRVLVGVGVFLLKDNLPAFQRQHTLIQELAPGGMVLFSYDDLTAEIVNILKD